MTDAPTDPPARPSDDDHPSGEHSGAEVAPSPPPARESTAAWWLLLLPSAVMVALTLLPSVAARGSSLQLHIWIAAGLMALAVLATSRRPPLAVITTIRRPHYMQALTQTGVFVYWGLYWEPVAGFLPLIVVQLAFAYQIDALLAWRRGDRYALGFGPLPVILSINLFMWFRDDVFGWQLVMVALCYLAKTVIAWNRDGRRRHIFNPSSFGLAVISVGLLLSGTSDLTYGREIALTQEAAPYFIHVLFALGLIVQLQFGVVLITASAAVSTWLLGVGFFAVTGVYMFATTDIPAAVFLGMLLLVTDPATSPRGTAAKVLFGAAYGALAFASYPVLEAMGSLGYYDKLLPVPLLNLLVRRFEGWGSGLQRLTRPRADRTRAVGSLRNLVHVGAWVGIFTMLISTDAVGREHPGRDILMWQRACVDQRFRACSTYFELLSADCDHDRGEACHNLGVELLEREQAGRPIEGRSSRTYIDKACTLGIGVSCQLAASLPPEGSPPSGPPPPVPAGAPPAGLAQACDGGEAIACHRLADQLSRGTPTTPPDEARARALYERGCELGSVSSCSSFAALVMRAGDGDPAMARQAFTKACDLGDAPGCANLAGMYQVGDGVEQDLGKAAKYNDKACGLGLGIACARLAQAYARGIGVEVDLPRAKELAGQACAHGFAPACGPPSP